METMILIAKLAIVVVVGLAALFGATETFKFKGQETSSINVPDSIPVEEGKDWILSAPLKDIWDMLTAGTRGFAMWMIRGVDLAIGTIIHLVFPNVEIPIYFSYIIVGFIFVFLFWKALDSLYAWGHEFGKYGMIIVVMIFAIAVIMMFM